MPLSDTAIKNAKPADKPYKIPDEKGMYLLVNSNGSKCFRLKYRFDGKEKVLALGYILKKEWRYFVTKTKVEHIVPLSSQVVSILRELHPLTNNGRFVFPSARTPNGSRPLSDAALLVTLRRLGFDKNETTIHEFRASARTILDEVLGVRVDLIEHQLAQEHITEPPTFQSVIK